MYQPQSNFSTRPAVLPCCVYRRTFSQCTLVDTCQHRKATHVDNKINDGVPLIVSLCHVSKWTGSSKWNAALVNAVNSKLFLPRQVKASVVKKIYWLQILKSLSNVTNYSLLLAHTALINTTTVLHQSVHLSWYDFRREGWPVLITALYCSYWWISPVEAAWKIQRVKCITHNDKPTDNY